MIRGVVVAALATVPVVSALALRRGVDRLLAAPRRMPDEAGLAGVVDELGGEIVRLRARDGVRLAARWLDAEPAPDWQRDPHEAVLLLHGYTGSILPDLAEYAPFLRRTAAVLGLDFRGHGDSDDGSTTFGLLEVEDVAGALAWLGERGITRVALVGTSMGGATAVAAVAILGDGSLTTADADPDAPRAARPPRPRVVAVVADSVPPEHAIGVANRLPGPFSRFVAERLFDGVARRLGGDPRATQPIRVIGLLEDVPMLLVHGDADRTVPIADADRLAAAAPSTARRLVIAGADHSAGHRRDPVAYESSVTAFLRGTFVSAREGHQSDHVLSPPAARGAHGEHSSAP